MTSIINFNQRVEKVREERVTLSHDLDGSMEGALYMYDEESTGLCGTLNVLDHFELASISSIKKHVVERLLEIQNSEYECESYDPWNDGGIIVCKEGAFTWSYSSSEYVWLGNVRRTIRYQTIRVKKETVVDYGNEEIHLEKGDKFILEGQYPSYDNDREPVIMLVAKQEGKAPIVLPYDQELVSLYYEDFAVVNYYRKTTKETNNLYS